MFNHRHGYHPWCKPPGPGLGQYVSKGSPCFLFSSLSVCVQQSSWSDTDWILATHQIVRLLKTPKSKSLNLYIDSQTPSLFFCFLLPLFPLPSFNSAHTASSLFLKHRPATLLPQDLCTRYSICLQCFIQSFCLLCFLTSLLC